jgi:hypothetical protein
MSLALIISVGVSLAAFAFIASMLGIGGGVFYTPIQLLFGLDIHEAAANSLFLIFILSVSATSVYHRSGKVDWRMAFVLELFTVTGGFVGGYFSGLVPQAILTGLLVAVILFAGALMFRGQSHPRHLDHAHRAFYLWRRQAFGECYELNLFLALPLSFMAGLLSCMVGIGGGALKVPMMVLLFGIPMDIVIATSGFMVGITALGGLAGHLAAGHWDWRMGLVLAPGVFIGAQFGARTMLRMGKRKLRRIFAVVLLFMAVMVVVKSLWG